MTSDKDRLDKIKQASGAERDKAVKDAFRAGVSATKITKATGGQAGTLLRRLARGGW